MRALVMSSYPAPYRVAVFQNLAKQYDLEVYFSRVHDEDRSADWFCKSGELPFLVLNNKTAWKQFIRTLLSLRKYDFVLAYDPACKTSIIAIAFCKLLRVPYFVNNDGAVPKPWNLVRYLVKRFIFTGAKLYFGSGASSEEYFLTYGAKKDRIRFHNFTSLTAQDILSAPVSGAEKLELRRKMNLDENGFFFITVGQFIDRKGFDLLLKAWTKVMDENVHLLMIGGGGKRAEYESYIAENGLKNVTIIDFLPKEKVFDYYKACDAFVLPTREDVWGLVVNEAMACGLPVISSDKCNAALELIAQEENGFLYPVNDTDELAGVMNRLVREPDLCRRQSENNIAKIQGNTMENVCKQHVHDISLFFGINPEECSDAEN